MKIINRLVNLFVICGLLLALTGSAGAQDPVPQRDVGAQDVAGTAFTYQGRLTDAGDPANGTYDFQFELYDTASDGIQVGVVTQDNIAVADGLFTVKLDFGAGVFTGNARYLEIGVRPGSSTGDYSTLLPRQALTPAPYALALPGLWTQQNATSPNVIGGHSSNSVADGVVCATISGGGMSGHPNQVTANYATIGGGIYNTASGDTTTIGGGYGNTATENSATIGGGIYNTASGNYATVGGGDDNTASGLYSTVGGGKGNTASSDSTIIGGGFSNYATGHAATIAGGYVNMADGSHASIVGGALNHADGGSASVGGGQYNAANGDFAAIAGGYYNYAGGDYSFAAGSHAKANNTGCFVWGDSTEADVECNDDNRWVARTSGGVYFYTNSILTSGVYVPPGGNSWNFISDRATKENLTPLDSQAILEKLATLPVQEYNLRSQEPSIRHVGPVAQDFYAAFGYGESNMAINIEDANGVALAAIQGLYQLLQEKDAQIDSLQARLTSLEALLAAMSEDQAGGEQR